MPPAARRRPPAPTWRRPSLDRSPATGGGVFRSPQAIASEPRRRLRVGGRPDQRRRPEVRQPGQLDVESRLVRRQGPARSSRRHRRPGHRSQQPPLRARQPVRPRPGLPLRHRPVARRVGKQGRDPGLLDLGTNGGAGGIAIHQPTPQDADPSRSSPTSTTTASSGSRSIVSARLDASSPALPTGTADAGNPNYVLDPTPAATWGSFGDCSAHGCGQPADEQLLNFPQGIAVNPQPDSTGRTLVYVADSLNHRVVQYADNGTYLGEVGGLGTGNGQFNSPYDVSVDSSGNLYVADYNNQRVQRFNARHLGFLDAWGIAGIRSGPVRVSSRSRLRR